MYNFAQNTTLIRVSFVTIDNIRFLSHDKQNIGKIFNLLNRTRARFFHVWKEFQITSGPYSGKMEVYH